MEKSEIIEELFARALESDSVERPKILDRNQYSDEICDAVGKLLDCHQSHSPYFKSTLIDDALDQDPEFFETSLDPAESPLAPSDVVGHFQVVRQIGSGGMSLVYLAEQTEPIERHVALKVIRPSLVHRDSIERFKRELQTQHQLEHPNIATFFDAGVIQQPIGSSPGLLYAAIQFIDGPHLNDYVAEHELTVREKVRVFCSVLHALDYAHQQNVVHRDVKPSNILVEVNGDPASAQPKLIDFGIAKVLTSGARSSTFETTVGHVVGSLRYMSPEQLFGLEVDFRTDIYSAGLVLIELLTNQPHRRENSRQAIVNSLRKPSRGTDFQATHWNRNDLSHKSSERLVSVIRKSIAEQPEQRYSSIGQFCRDLESVCSDRPISIADQNWLAQSVPTLLKHRYAIVVILLIGLLTAAGLYANFLIGKKQDEISQLQRGTERVREKSLVMNEVIVDLVTRENFQFENHTFDPELFENLKKQKSEIQSRGGPRNFEDQTAYLLLAMMCAKKLDFEQADTLIALARENATLSPKLRQISNSIYQFFLNQLASVDSEKQCRFVRGKCRAEIGQNQMATADLREFIQQQNSNSPSVEELTARMQLATLYRTAPDMPRYRELVKATHQRFRDQDMIRTTERGALEYFALVYQLYRFRPSVHQNEFRQLKKARAARRSLPTE